MTDSSHNALESIPAPDSGVTGLLPTALAAALGKISSSIPLTEYRGSQTVEKFSEASAELAALLTDTGIYDLGWREFLHCTGKDRVRWLNGMVTNSVTGLKPNTGCYSFVLNAHGRIQGDLDIYFLAQQPDVLWLEVDRAQVETLMAFMRRYIIMDKVTLEPQAQWTAIGIAGPDAARKLSALSFPVSGLEPVSLVEASWRGHAVVLVATHSPCVPRYEVWIETDAVSDLWQALAAAGAMPCGADAVEQLRIAEGTPAYGVDIVERHLPQETDQMRALNFTKGCYLGQEIVERIRSRGNVHRMFSGFVLNDLVPAKTTLLSGEKTAGELTSVARVSVPAVGERILALGYVRSEDRSTSLTGNGISATPYALPFAFPGIAARAAVEH